MAARKSAAPRNGGRAPVEPTSAAPPAGAGSEGGGGAPTGGGERAAPATKPPASKAPAAPRPRAPGEYPAAVQEGAGVILAALFWTWVALPFLRGGMPEVRKMLRAKFFNKDAQGRWLP